MIEVTPFEELGRFENEWLRARHHFSFGSYFDPRRIGFGSLRVWNDDSIAPASGFDLHGHRDMEIITYVRRGAISHEDNRGNRGRTEAGDVQVMSAGKGILHAEYNYEPSETQIFQIWIEPAVMQAQPRWEARAFPKVDRAGELVALASGRAGDEDALPIHQDAAIRGALLKAGQVVSYPIGRDRKAYIVGASGRFKVNGVAAKARDGIAVNDADQVLIEADADSEILLADVA